MVPFSIIFVGEFCVTIYKHGMNRAPQGCLNLSHPGFAELLEYVEKNF